MQQTAIILAMFYWLLDILTDTEYWILNHSYFPSPRVTDHTLFTLRDGIAFCVLGHETQGSRVKDITLGP